VLNFLIKIPFAACAILVLVYTLAWLTLNAPLLLTLALFVGAGWVGVRLGRQSP